MSSDSESETSNFENRIKHLNVRSNILVRGLNNVKKCPKARLTPSYLNTKRSLAHTWWNDYAKAFNAAVLSATPDEIGNTAELSDDVYTKYEDIYSDLISVIDTAENRFPDPVVVNSDGGGLGNQGGSLAAQPGQQLVLHAQKEMLKPLSLPKFNGEFDSWLAFHDLYVSLVHNNKKLSGAQKLQYLKSHVEEEAHTLLLPYAISDANYKPAWDLMLRVYHHKRLLIDGQLKLLFGLESIQNESTKNLRNLIYTTDQCIRSLSNLGVDTTNWDYLMIHLTVNKMPVETRRLWEQEIADSDDLPDFETFMAFIEARYRSLLAMGVQTTPVQKPKQQVMHVGKDGCPVCRGQHALESCSTFIVMTPENRSKSARKLDICFRCLKKGHRQNGCKSRDKCIHCKMIHHTLLHGAMQKAQSQDASTSGTKKAGIEQKACLLILQGGEKVFATALVNVITKTGDRILLRTLIDPTSDACFITKAAFRLLKQRLVRERVTVTGLGGEQVGSSQGSVTFDICSIHGDEPVCSVSASVVSSVSRKQPQRCLEGWESWEHFKGLQLADPSYNTPGNIDLLLDVEVFASIIRSGLIKVPGSPNAHETSLGWIVLGVASRQVVCEPKVVSVMHTNAVIEEQLKQFWEQEEVQSVKQLSQEERKCEDFYCKTTVRREDGRFQISLPMLSKLGEIDQLGKSKHIAKARFRSLEKNLNRDVDLNKRYRKCIDEYFVMNHIGAVQCQDSGRSDAKNVYYIPHHAVMKGNDKFRVVFDASCKTDSGKSLNDCMLSGPKLQVNLYDIINSWRRYRYSFQADILKMYRQIYVSREDADLQRVFWRKDEGGSIAEYRLLRVTFGVKSSPYVAIRTLHLLADLEKDRFPVAYHAVKREFYVDDLRSGGDTIDETVELRKQVIGMLDSGGFPLRKWVANDKRLLEGVPREHLDEQTSLEIIDKVNGMTVKSLGLLWDPIRDAFQFSIKERQPWKFLSKRLLLSKISSLYDPMGWVSPFVIKAKILMQRVWKESCDWDEAVHPSVEREWKAIEDTMDSLREIRIPRWFGTYKDTRTYQIHGFCDASEKALAAVVYLRAIDESGNVSVHLISSKSKVAPLKVVTLPKLELCSAVVLSEMCQALKTSMNLVPTKYCLWSDSQVALSWIKKEPFRWNTNVGNRVATVQRNSRGMEWLYVPTGDNPADCASRGMLPSELVGHRLWWSGPEWLKGNEDGWPKGPIRFHTELELKAKTVMHIGVDSSLGLIGKFSSLRTMIRTVARICNLKVPRELRGSSLQISQLEYALIRVVKLCQERYFAVEMGLSKDNEVLAKRTGMGKALEKLSPFLDGHGVLRVGGRLKHLTIPFNRKHPVILPRDSHLTDLIIRDTHLKTMHGGIQEVLNCLRKKFWILGGRNTIQQVLKSCVNCARVKARLSEQVMAALPIPRVSEGLTFIHVGVDYAGPITYRASTLRKAPRLKGYIALFICLTTKAVNLQVVSDRSKEKFLMAFTRFTSIRGTPAHMYSDNEKSFVGADQLIKNDLSQLFKDVHVEVAEVLAGDGIEWHFNPPMAPHHGGLWESNIRSTKRHLYATLSRAVLTYEELGSVLSKIEACLNSRPLCAMSEDPEDSECLTPAHFLIGRPLLSVAEPNYLDIKESSLTRWRFSQKLTQEFWKRWSEEYLITLQKRHKWNKEKESLRVGDLVLLKEDLLPSLRWLRGRVVEVCPGKDGRVRVVKVRTHTHILERDVRRLGVLPVREM